MSFGKLPLNTLHECVVVVGPGGELEVEGLRDGLLAAGGVQAADDAVLDASPISLQNRTVVLGERASKRTGECVSVCGGVCGWDSEQVSNSVWGEGRGGG